MTNSRIHPLDTNLVVQEVDILDGHLLGDGSVFTTKANKGNCVFSMSCKHRGYLEWLTSNTYFLLNRPLYPVSTFDKRTKKTYSRYYIKSLSSEIFTFARQRWYKDRKKVLPNDLIITRRNLLRFYLDDGSYHPNGAYLATNDFTPSDVEVLRDKISSFCGFQLSIHKTGAENVYKLFVKKTNRQNFLEIIGQCPVDCYAYKWGE